MTAVVEGSVNVVARSVAEALAAGVPVGSVVCASLPDGPVPGWLVVEDVVASEPGRRCAIVRLDGCAVAASGWVSEVKVAGDPVPTEGPMPAWARALAESFWAGLRYQAETESARRALIDHEARLEVIVDAAHDYANDNALCERFDTFMMSQGLRPRTRDWVCEVDATVRVRVAVSSHSADAAGGEVTGDLVEAAIAALGSGGLADALHDHDVIDVEEA